MTIVSLSDDRRDRGVLRVRGASANRPFAARPRRGLSRCKAGVHWSNTGANSAAHRCSIRGNRGALDHNSDDALDYYDHGPCSYHLDLG